MSDGRYTDAYGRNVEAILCQGTRIVKGTIPRQVRKELMVAVKAGVLGRLPKDGLKPEAFYHTDHLHLAKELQSREAVYAAECVAKVLGHNTSFTDAVLAQPQGDGE